MKKLLSVLLLFILSVPVVYSQSRKITLQKGVAVSNPATGYTTLYINSSGVLHTIQSDGTDLALGATLVSSVFGRTGAVVKANNDYDDTNQNFNSLIVSPTGGSYGVNITTPLAGSTTPLYVSDNLGNDAFYVDALFGTYANSFNSLGNYSDYEDFFGQGGAGKTANFLRFNRTGTGNVAIIDKDGIATFAGFIGPLTGNVTGNVTGTSGSTTGNAATATILQTSRDIAGQAFNGSANISIASTNLSDTANIARLDAANSFTNTNSFAGLKVNTSAAFGTAGTVLFNPYVTVDNLANVVITASAADKKALVVQGFTAQTEDIFQVQSSAASSIISVAANRHLIVNSGGNDMIFDTPDGVGGFNRIFRGLNTTGWTDSATGTFFQVGATGNTFFTSSGGAEFTRLMFSALGLQLGDLSYTLFDPPVARTAVQISQKPHNAGSPTALLISAGAHTALAASVEASDVVFDLSRTVNFATGALATQRAFRIEAPTYSFTAASVLTDAATVAITGAPIAGTNATITRPMALWVQAGLAQFDGGITGNLTGYSTALKSATTTVSVSAATAPTVGQVLTAVDSTSATWQTPAAGSAAWNGITAPTGNAAIAMAAFTTAHTFNATTGAVTNLYTIQDTASNTGTGFIFNVKTATSSAAHPMRLSKATMPTTLDKPYLQLGANEFITNGYSMIGFGYYDQSSNTKPSVAIGSQMVSTASFTKSDFIVATRSADSNTDPIERLRVTNAGFIGINRTATPVYTLQLYSVAANAAAVNIYRGTQSGAQGSPVTDMSSPYIRIGGNEYATNIVSGIGFGWSQEAVETNMPSAFIGFQMTNITSSTMGELIFGTRPTATNVAPTERLRIKTDGTLNTAYQFISTLATGTAPFSVASTTNVANLNASSLNGATFANPGTIGTTPAAITGTTITANTSLTINGGTAVTKILSNTAVLDFASTAAGTATDLTITVTSAALGDTVSIGVPHGSTVAAGDFSAWVSAANTVTVRFCNNQLVSALDPASGTFRATVIQH